MHALRTGAGLSQEELAQAAGLSVRALSDLERGRTRGPQRRTVRALATVLGLDVRPPPNWKTPPASAAPAPPPLRS
ncbi:helix-turn-helix domain-containing protein [Streptomyces sp. NPDC059835]|uniref:helix-turn-helix domain-containing protein n=1 Tax=Streptomyces sp. NPDC059835 TaxID=3346967 RepID=UPI0036540587